MSSPVLHVVGAGPSTTTAIPAEAVVCGPEPHDPVAADVRPDDEGRTTSEGRADLWTTAPDRASGRPVGW